MSALTKGRPTAERAGDQFSYPLLAATAVQAGSIAVLDSSGWLKPAIEAAGLTCAGRSEAFADNSGGGNGGVLGEVKSGVFRWDNSTSSDLITKAEIGDDCYLVDDQTVAKTDGSATRSRAGTIVDVDSVGVWVRMGI